MFTEGYDLDFDPWPYSVSCVFFWTNRGRTNQHFVHMFTSGEPLHSPEMLQHALADLRLSWAFFILFFGRRGACWRTWIRLLPPPQKKKRLGSRIGVPGSNYPKNGVCLFGVTWIPRIGGFPFQTRVPKFVIPSSA